MKTLFGSSNPNSKNFGEKTGRACKPGGTGNGSNKKNSLFLSLSVIPPAPEMEIDTKVIGMLSHKQEYRLLDMGWPVSLRTKSATRTDLTMQLFKSFGLSCKATVVGSCKTMPTSFDNARQESITYRRIGIDEPSFTLLGKFDLVRLKVPARWSGKMHGKRQRLASMLENGGLLAECDEKTKTIELFVKISNELHRVFRGRQQDLKA
ncbi:hypothetical protein FJZ26_00095 [Candidatus Parvarchaeota archaeon]|nr:hypothetical protein [Candidatus Parvarchaeota archaeon]